MGTLLTGLECRFKRSFIKRFLKPCLKGPTHITERRMPTQVAEPVAATLASGAVLPGSCCRVRAAETGVIQGWH